MYMTVVVAVSLGAGQQDPCPSASRESDNLWIETREPQPCVEQ